MTLEYMQICSCKQNTRISIKLGIMFIKQKLKGRKIPTPNSQNNMVSVKYKVNTTDCADYIGQQSN